MTQEDVDKLSDAEQEAIINQATTELNNRVNETKPFFNVVRNENGSVTVPESIDDGDAVNKQTLITTINNRIDDLINNAPEELDTLKELADTLSKNKNGIQAINTALTNRYTKEEADDTFIQKAAFVLNGTTLEINF